MAENTKKVFVGVEIWNRCCQEVFQQAEETRGKQRGQGTVFILHVTHQFIVLITFCLSSHHHLLLPSETLAAFQVAASGERTPARSAVGAAAFQFAKTTFRFVRAGDLWITSHFIKCCQSQSALVEPELRAEGLQQRPGSGSSSRDYKGRAALSRQDVSALQLTTVLQRGFLRTIYFCC